MTGHLLRLLLVLLLTAAATSALAQDTLDSTTQTTQEELLFRAPWGDWTPSNEPLLAAPDRTPVSLALSDAIARALECNLDLKVSRLGPTIRMTDVTRAEAAFDAVLFAEAQGTWRDTANIDTGFFTRSVTTPSGTKEIKIPTDPFVKSQDYNYALGLRKRLPSGAQVELAQNLRRFRVNEAGLFRNPFYEWSLDLELRQPLLRDFGIDVNRANINIARNNFAISQQEFNLQVIEVVAEIESLYWRLVFARQQVRILEQLVEQSQRTLDRLQVRTTLDAASGVIARNQGLIQRARADLVSARNSVLEVQDRLLERLNDPDRRVGELWEIIPLDTPSLNYYPLERPQALARGLRLRPELRAQDLTIDNAAIGVGIAENQRLPRLDLIARQETTGAGVNPDTAWDTQREYDTINYVAALSFEIPLGNRAAEADLLKAKHQYRQEQLRLASFREQVLADVSISLQDLENLHQEITERRLAAEAEGNTLQAYLAQENTDAKITADFLNRKLDAEERLARAQATLAQTIYSYNVAILQAQRAQGALLHYNNIHLTELEAPPSR